MEIKGEEFIKKTQIKEEREELEEKLSEIEEVQPSISENDTIYNEDISEPIIDRREDTQLGNIMLDEPMDNKEDNKKKYLILGLVLVILFLFTIIIIRLFSDSSQEDDFTSNKTDPIETRTTNDNNIEENFQKIMNERIKNDNTENLKEEVNSEEKMNAIEEEREIASNTKEIVQKSEIVPVKNVTPKIEKKPEVKKVEKKVVQKKKEVVKHTPSKSIKQLVNEPSSYTQKGYYVQIGAFSKKPSSSYTNKIKNANLKYKIHQVTVKGKLYNKVLIGPYSSRASAQGNIKNIKNKLKVSSAYILKI